MSWLTKHCHKFAINRFITWHLHDLTAFDEQEKRDEGLSGKNKVDQTIFK